MDLLEFKYKKLVSYLKKLLEKTNGCFIETSKIELILEFLEDEEEKKDELN